MESATYLTKRCEDFCICLELGRLHNPSQDWKCSLQDANSWMHGLIVTVDRSMTLKKANQGGQISQVLKDVLPQAR